MKILVTNNHLKMLAGSETFTYTLANELLRQGHQVEIFTLVPGVVSERLKAEGFPIHINKKSLADKYDLILANHTSTVSQVFKKGFTIQTCHGLKNKIEQPHPCAHAHVSISREMQQHLERKGFQSKIIMNGVNTVRFAPKIPTGHQVMTIISLSFSEDFNDAIRAATQPLGITLITRNKFKNPIWNIEDEINEADLVISLGRGCYEGMSCGRPVFVFDMRKYQGLLGDGLLKEDNIETAMSHNCSGRAAKLKMLPNALFDALIDINENPGIYGSFSRTYALKYLDIEKQVRKYMGIVMPQYDYEEKTESVII